MLNLYILKKTLNAHIEIYLKKIRKSNILAKRHIKQRDSFFEKFVMYFASAQVFSVRLFFLKNNPL